MGRIVDIVAATDRIGLRGQALVVVSASGKSTIPLSEVDVVFLRHPGITCTQEALVALSRAGCVVICCDEESLPAAASLPVACCHPPARQLEAQIAVPRSVRNRLWRQIVQVRVESQGRLLRDMHGSDFGLLQMAAKVRSGDPEDIHGKAAEIYWPALFDHVAGRKVAVDPEKCPHLCFARSLLVAALARALCGAGLHPGMRLHPRGEECSFGLALDLAEPLRTGMEACVYYLLTDRGAGDGPEMRDRILRVCDHPRLVDGEQRMLAQAAEHIVKSLVDVYEGRRQLLALPAV